MKLKEILKKGGFKSIRQNRLQVKTNELDQKLCIKKKSETDKVIALAGNPNVGKSTVFNQLTGLNQHTGNWPGKTVANAQGYCTYQENGYVLVDIPGCYSLMAHSTEEEVARDFICFENPDAVIVVCDATCLERNLNLVLQILEVTKNVVVCVNLMDEARKKDIHINLDKMKERLGVPVIGTAARNKEGLEQIFEELNHLLEKERILDKDKMMEEKSYTQTQKIKDEKTSEEAQKLEVRKTYEEAQKLEEGKTYEEAQKLEEGKTPEETQLEKEELSKETQILEQKSSKESQFINTQNPYQEVQISKEEIIDKDLIFWSDPISEEADFYPKYIEKMIVLIEPFVSRAFPKYSNKRWLSARLLDADESLLQSIGKYIEVDEKQYEILKEKLLNIEKELEESFISKKQVNDDMAASFVRKAEKICKECIRFETKEYSKRDRTLDRLFTSKLTGFPIMFLILLGIFWLTITGANYPSKVLSDGLFWIQDRLLDFFIWVGAPKLLYEMLVLGVYRVLAWVVSVMLPPMAIFFPLFTLLEDFGFLPRVAYNLDRCFKRCSACGKQSLTMMMGFGCNAAGVIGCRIIDSPRERLIAIITNNFVPCNGRFPTLIAIITMFFIGSSFGWFSSIMSAAILSLIIVLGILMTLLVSKLLSVTILKGIPSSFTLELPPYRRPQIGKVIIRSICDRTLFVLSRAVIIAMPAGFLIWVMANVTIADATLLSHCSNFLDPFGRFLGMDGVILLAFILGFPANEIVVPIIIMAYLAQGSLLEIDDLNVLKKLFVDNGWNIITAISTMLFSLMHWPCSTTCLTIRKETQSKKWMFISFITPTIIGIVVCALFSNIARLFL